MADWKKYTKNSYQELGLAPHGFIVKYDDGSESEILTDTIGCNAYEEKNATHYLICEPLPHAEMRAMHALTGQEVEYKAEEGWFDMPNEVVAWYKDVEYRFNFPPTKKKIRFRNFLGKNCAGNYVGTITPGDKIPEDYFIKWLGEWQEVEVEIEVDD